MDDMNSTSDLMNEPRRLTVTTKFVYLGLHGGGYFKDGTGNKQC